jgi:hypothetical protein
MQGTCPNCQIRPADTDVEFHEVLHSRYQSRMWAMGWWQDRSIRGFYKSGRARLCARCAANYRRIVQMRTNGMRALNYGFAALLAGAVLFGIGAAAMPAWSAGISGLLLASPMALALLVMLTGGVIYIVGVVRWPAAARFVERVHVYMPSASGASLATAAEDSGPAPVSPVRTPQLTHAERVAARARRRLRRRLTWAGGILAWLAVVVVAVLIYTTSLGSVSRIAHGIPNFTDPLTSNANGWPNHGACTFHDDAYHIVPINLSEGVTCYSPAGGYQDLDLRVTAELVSGPLDGFYGLAFRAIDGGDTYVFAVSGDGYAAVDINMTGTISQLSPTWTIPAGPLGRGTPHDLRVVARGSAITCFVDGAQVGTISDTRYTRGLVGLSVVTPGIDVAFTNFAVSPA